MAVKALLENPTYEERGLATRTKAVAAGLSGFRRTYKKFDAAARSIEGKSIEAANLARELGIRLQTMCGHEQVSFEFWRDYCEEKLQCSFSEGKMFVAIARKMPQPVETIGEAMQFVHLALMADGLLELPERTEMQSRALVSGIERFFAEITLMRIPFDKVVTTMPLERWDFVSLGKFLSETEWLYLERQKAEKLLEGKK